MTTTSPAALEEQRQSLLKQFLGTNLRDAPVPSAVLDLSIVKRNCARMLEAVDSLGFGWRAHIKTHKVRSHSHYLIYHSAVSPFSCLLYFLIITSSYAVPSLPIIIYSPISTSCTATNNP
jgi:D-serine deaminase-like pyridoxal phosphate-dependent protein